MKKLLIILALMHTLAATGQEDEQAAIMQVVTNVFEAMRTNDSTLLKVCFVAEPNMCTVLQDQADKSNLQKGDFSRFVSAVGRPKGQKWNEPIWNEKVEIDGELASVWVDYAFYLDSTFSHCGVDAFHLVKLDGAWKIFHLVDTRRKENCQIPEGIKP